MLGVWSYRVGKGTAFTLSLAAHWVDGDFETICREAVRYNVQANCRTILCRQLGRDAWLGEVSCGKPGCSEEMSVIRKAARSVHE